MFFITHFLITTCAGMGLLGLSTLVYFATTKQTEAIAILKNANREPGNDEDTHTDMSHVS